MPTSTTPVWLPTTAAAMALGCSAVTLKRKRDICGGFLEAGTHYTLGSELNSPIVWNVPAIREVMHRRGLMARAADQTITELRTDTMATADQRLGMEADRILAVLGSDKAAELVAALTQRLVHS